MGDVKRYDPVVAEDYDPPFGMVPGMLNDEGGHFVHYMDYAAILTRHNALVEAVAWEGECGTFHYNGRGECWWNGCIELHNIMKAARAEVDRLLKEKP